MNQSYCITTLIAHYQSDLTYSTTFFQFEDAMNFLRKDRSGVLYWEVKLDNEEFYIPIFETKGEWLVRKTNELALDDIDEPMTHRPTPLETFASWPKEKRDDFIKQSALAEEDGLCYGLPDRPRQLMTDWSVGKTDPELLSNKVVLIDPKMDRMHGKRFDGNDLITDEHTAHFGKCFCGIEAGITHHHSSKVDPFDLPPPKDGTMEFTVGEECYPVPGSSRMCPARTMSCERSHTLKRVK